MTDSAVHFDERTVVDQLKIGQDFGDILDEATQNLDHVWQYHIQVGESECRGLGWPIFPRKTLTYQDPWVMAIWNAYRITKISLHTGLAKVYGMVEEAMLRRHCGWHYRSVKGLRDRSLEIVDSMNEEICASIAWCLGDTNYEGNKDLPLASKASLSIAGLRAVANGIYSRQEHTLQARAALVQIAYRFGIKGALV